MRELWRNLFALAVFPDEDLGRPRKCHSPSPPTSGASVGSAPMDDELEELRREVEVLRRLVTFALPYVPLQAGNPEIQAELDRAVFGADFLERVGLAYAARQPN